MVDGDGKDLLDFLVQEKSPAYFIFFTSTLNIQPSEIPSNFLGVIDKPLVEVLTSTVLKVFSKAVNSI